MRKATLDEMREQADLIAAAVVTQIRNGGGYTYKPHSATARLEYHEWTVNLKYTERVMASADNLHVALRRRIFTNTLLWVLRKASRCVGVWRDDERGGFEIADVVLFGSQQDAEMFARTQNQRYIYNLVKGLVAVPPADERSDNG